VLILALFLTTGCTDVHPVVKIGLIAPFEGIYRESGYAALAAMRQALDECAPPGMALLPLALDDGGDPMQAQRAAQKLLVDPAVHAIIGPLLLDSVPALAKTIGEPKTETVPAGEEALKEGERIKPTWLIPLLVLPTHPTGGFAHHSSSAPLQAQVDFIATTTPATRILLVGLSSESPWEVSAATVTGQSTTRPVIRIDDPDAALAAVESRDALLWLGRPDAGARWLSALRAKQPDVDFWLMDQAGIDVFTAHAENLHATHLLVWSDIKYNAWSQSAIQATEENDFMHYRVYRATCATLDKLGADVAAQSSAWELQERLLEQ
jgi:hypothetical protein